MTAHPVCTMNPKVQCSILVDNLAIISKDSHIMQVALNTAKQEAYRGTWEGSIRPRPIHSQQSEPTFTHPVRQITQSKVHLLSLYRTRDGTKTRIEGTQSQWMSTRSACTNSVGVSRLSDIKGDVPEITQIQYNCITNLSY